jgi:hypothetical protein
LEERDVRVGRWQGGGEERLGPDGGVYGFVDGFLFLVQLVYTIRGLVGRGR